MKFLVWSEEAMFPKSLSCLVPSVGKVTLDFGVPLRKRARISSLKRISVDSFRRTNGLTGLLFTCEVY